MKNTTFRAITLLLMGAMMMTACDPEEIVSPEPEQPANPVSDVYQTAWINEQTDTYEDEYGNLHESVETNIIRFETETTGHMESSYVTDTQNENENESYPFTYTYSTPNGTFTFCEGGETETFNFSYNAGNNTLKLDDNEGYYLVFTRLQE